MGDARKSLGSPMLRPVLLTVHQNSRRRPPPHGRWDKLLANCQEDLAVAGAGALVTSLRREGHVRP